jgi:hypothetical protein
LPSRSDSLPGSPCARPCPPRPMHHTIGGLPEVQALPIRINAPAIVIVTPPPRHFREPLTKEQKPDQRDETRARSLGRASHGDRGEAKRPMPDGRSPAKNRRPGRKPPDLRLGAPWSGVLPAAGPSHTTIIAPAARTAATECRPDWPEFADSDEDRRGNQWHGRRARGPAIARRPFHAVPGGDGSSLSQGTSLGRHVRLYIRNATETSSMD